MSNLFCNSFIDVMLSQLSPFNTLVEFISLGEKYELAKKLAKIKLVNHRWLEDWYVHLHSLML